MRSALHRPDAMRFIARASVTLALIGIEVLRRWGLASFFASRLGFVVLIMMWTLLVYLLSRAVFDALQRAQLRLERQNQDLLALHRSSLQIETHGDLEQVLRRILHTARETVGAKYGGLTHLAPDGSIGVFLTEGWACDGSVALPGEHGLIGAVTREGSVLRTDKINEHPESVGFPAGHPLMEPLLAVPIASGMDIFGHLYLADDAGKRFDAEGEETLLRFGALAAVAIENARLHQSAQVTAINEERERIAREMHDSLAQVLGYVNTKAQATRVLLDRDRATEAKASLDQMATASREAYDDVRESILGLRMSLGDGTNLIAALESYLETWQEQANVQVTMDADKLNLDEIAGLTEVQLLRIIQEALSNVRKHAHAKHVQLTLETGPTHVTVDVADDGVGLGRQQRETRGMPRFGLSTMRERAESLGGTVDIVSRPTGGTRVVVTIPRSPLLD